MKYSEFICNYEQGEGLRWWVVAVALPLPYSVHACDNIICGIHNRKNVNE